MKMAGAKDRRVSRTRSRLTVALRGLIQQKPLREITVQDVLDAAGVSRSTFYAHFEDTEDLFLTDVDEFLQHMANCLSKAGDKSERLVAVREFFAHVGEAKSMQLALARSDRLADFFDLATEHFARGIERRLGELPRSRALSASERQALAQALAGALIAQLRWWIARKHRPSPEQMDEWFHRFAWAGIAK
ncbi:MAG TPA: TetR/AcrR family transcriptional regulator [Terriglobales bacterium]|nr:TetR/AcrR family transcriptional regulator [Terriglobales bacterium]